MQTNRDVAMLVADLRRYVEGHGPQLPVAVEVWRDIGSPGCDEPIARAYFDSEAGYVVLETVRRFPRGGTPSPLGMGVPAGNDRDGWHSDAKAPEGTITAGALLEALRSCGSAEAVAVRLFEGDNPDVTDVGIASVMEFPLQEDGMWEEDDGTFTDSYGNAVPPGEEQVAYVVLSTNEEFMAG